MLLDHGHPRAWDYPLPTVADEAALIVRRVNAQIATEAIAFKAAGTALITNSTEGNKLFDQVIERLLG